MPSSRGSSCLRRLLHWQVGSLPLAPLGKPQSCRGLHKSSLETFWEMFKILCPEILEDLSNALLLPSC